MDNNGWVKLHRKLLDNCIYKDANLLQLFIYCLLKANHKPNTILFNYQEITIQRGQFITGRLQLAKELNQKPSSLRNRLQLLEKLGILDIKSNNKFSMVTVLNYSTYQDEVTLKGQQKGQPLDNHLTTKGQPLDTNNNDNKEKKEKKFQNIPPTLIEVVERAKELNYSNVEIETNKFYNYYESNGWKVSKNKMVNWSSALVGWFSRSGNFNNNGNSEKAIPVKSEYEKAI
jgi:hypothetical protein